MKTSEIAVTLSIACLCGLLGCSQAVDTPSSSVRANAMEDYQAGRFDAAIAGFEHVLKSDPKDYLAHFQLATLLQEQRKDYLGAIVHFRLYLDLRPADDKTTLAADRIEDCKNMLLGEQTRKKGGTSAKAAETTAADKKQAEENARLSKEVARLRDENKNLRYLLSSLGEASKGRASAMTAEVKKMLADLRVSDDEEPRRKSIIPTDRELLDDDGEGGPVVASPEVKDQISKVKREETSGPARPTPIKQPALPPDEFSGAPRPPIIKKPPIIVDNSPEPDPKPVPGGARGGALDGLLGGGKKPPAAARPSVYVIQSGDNLMNIAMRFYGSRSKWRDIQKANMTTIPADGRVKAGQTIKLP
jgi:nucleoid-associated protein YgaU